MTEPKRVLIYDNGQQYYIDSDMLYEPFPKSKDDTPREIYKGYNEKEKDNEKQNV